MSATCPASSIQCVQVVSGRKVPQGGGFADYGRVVWIDRSDTLIDRYPFILEYCRLFDRRAVIRAQKLEVAARVGLPDML